MVFISSLFQPPADTVYMTDAPPPYPGINGHQGYSNGGGAVGGAGGWSAPASNMTSAQRKEAEAAGSAAQVQNGYYDPNNPQFAYVPPPAYSDLPPSYGDSNKKND